MSNPALISDYDLSDQGKDCGFRDCMHIFHFCIMNTCTQSSQNQHYHNLSYEHNALFFLKLTKVNNDTFIDMWMKSLTLLWWRMWGIRYTKLTLHPYWTCSSTVFNQIFNSVLQCVDVLVFDKCPQIINMYHHIWQVVGPKWMVHLLHKWSSCWLLLDFSWQMLLH